MSESLYRTALRNPLRRLAAAGLIVAGLCCGTISRATDVNDVVGQVSVDSYTDCLDNDLYAHDGDAREFGAKHDLARQSIQTRFEGFGLDTRLDPFTYGGTEYYNVVGVLPGVMRPRETYIVGAHYDSVSGSPGASDNATSVAMVIEAARVLSPYLFEATIVFIAFDREEQGLLGSEAYAARHKDDDIRATIVLDVTAYRPYTPDQPQYNAASLYYQSTRPAFVDALAGAMETYAGLACSVAKNPGSLLSDYVPFDRHGLPAVVLTSFAGAVNYFIHTPQDTLDRPGYIDYDYGAQMAQGVVGYLAASARLEPVRMRPDFDGDWNVDIDDLALLTERWDQNDPAFDIAPPPSGDGIVDIQDIDGLMHYWNQEIAEPGLIGHWKLDETDGVTAADSAGIHDGTLGGGPVWQPSGGAIDGALQLDGKNDFVGAACTLDPSNESFSVFAWVKGGAPGQVILSRDGGVNWMMADASDGSLRTELRCAGRFGWSSHSAIPITDGDWHRVGLTWDGSNRILYVDNVEAAKDTQDGLPSSTSRLNIGTGSKRAAGSFWFGLIDDVRIYDRAVTP